MPSDRVGEVPLLDKSRQHRARDGGRQPGGGVLTGLAQCAAPSCVAAKSSIVRDQPDSSGTVPSEPAFSAGGVPWWVPQEVQPVAGGRLPLQCRTPGSR